MFYVFTNLFPSSFRWIFWTVEMIVLEESRNGERFSYSIFVRTNNCKNADNSFSL